MSVLRLNPAARHYLLPYVFVAFLIFTLCSREMVDTLPGGWPVSALPYVEEHKMSKSSGQRDIVIGIPTMYRDGAEYLFDTLDSLFDNMEEAESSGIKIVVMIVDRTNEDYVEHVKEKILDDYPHHFELGNIEVVLSPPLTEYGHRLEHLKTRYGDSQERTFWRSKQSLDFALLMEYSRTQGNYYLQLEDDVITVPGYVTKMKKFAAKHNQLHPNWSILHLSTLGFIGKLFNTASLPSYISKFTKEFDLMPVDILLWKMEKKLGGKKFVHNPTLFQHIGDVSSLKGKKQMIKDKYFKG